MNRIEFKAAVQKNVLLLDGAMGTALHRHGYPTDQSFDGLNLSQPAVVAGIHRSYVDAGVDVIETNSFGANRYQLADYRLENQVAEINQQAVKIARSVIESSFKPVLLAGAVGPLGVRLAPLGRITIAQAEAAFSEQIAALIEAGVDLLLLETMTDIHEVTAAVKAAREISAEIPIVAFMTFTRDDRTLLGNTSSEVAAKLAALDVDMIGANCSGGPAQMLRLIATMKLVSAETPIGASPNAGWPETSERGRMLYPATDTYFGDYARAFKEAGVSMMGGCCGTTPEHISAMRQAIDGAEPNTIPLPKIMLVEQSDRPVAAADPPTQLAETLERGELIVTVEMRPPKGIAAQKMLEGARMLKQAGANFLNVADIPLARMRMSAWAAAYLVQQEVGVETILHFPTRGRNLLRVQADLLAAHALGVRNLFVTMGDPTRIGDYPDAMDSYDIVSTGLVKLIKDEMNEGRDKAGAKLDQPTNFVVGCAASLNPRDLAKEAKLLNKKIRFGADYALTQPIFNPEKAREFIAFYEAEYGALTLPLILGIQPLYNARNAEFLHNEVPGITIPQSYRDRMQAASDKPQDEGVRISQEIIAELRDSVQGIYIIPAFGRYDLAADVIDSIRRGVV